MHPPVWWDGDGNLLTAGPDGRPAYVMVRFEQPLMEKIAARLCRNGGRILNVGFGCGLVDEAIQRHAIESHVIVEPHPAVYARMLAAGWGGKPNVRILHARWQDVAWREFHGAFDGIFFDPYPFDRAAPHGLEAYAWSWLAVRLLKPETGVLINYEVGGDPERVREGALAALERFARARVEVDSAEVDVPFVIPEYAHLGPGRHTVYFACVSVPSA